MPRIWSKGAVTTPGGEGEVYKAGEGLEETGTKPTVFHIKLLGVVESMLSEALQAKYAVLLGRGGTGQILKGGSGTEGKEHLELWSNAEESNARIILGGENPARVEIPAPGSLFVPAISGLESLEGQVLIGAKELIAALGFIAKGACVFPEETPAALAGKITNNYNPGAFSRLRIKATEETWVTGLKVAAYEVGGVAAGAIVWITNFGTTTINFPHETGLAQTGKLTTAKKDVKELTSTKELYIGQSVTGESVKAGSTILTIPSETEITLSANAEATKNSALTFTSPSTAANRFQFQAEKTVALKPKQTLELHYDNGTTRWRGDWLGSMNPVELSGAQTIGGVKTFSEAVKTKGLLTAEAGFTGEGTIKFPNESLKAAFLEKESVETAKIKLLNVTTGTLAAEAVSAPKALIATTPSPSATKNTVVLGVAGVARKITAAVTTETGKKGYVVKHALNTSPVSVTVQTVGFEQPEVTVDKSVSLNANEVEMTFGGVVADKEQYYVTVIG